MVGNQHDDPDDVADADDDFEAPVHGPAPVLLRPGTMLGAVPGMPGFEVGGDAGGS